MRLVALLLAPGILLGQVQLAPGSLGSVYYASTTEAKPLATVWLRAVGSSTPISALVVSTAGGTITFVVPSNAPLGPAELIYKVTGSTTQWSEVSIVPANFTINAIQTPHAAGTGQLNDLTHPVQPSDVVAIWGTGLGLTSASNVTVTFGGVAQKVPYAGPAPNLLGVNQIDFQVAAGVPDGCYVPATVSVGASSAVTYLAKSSNGGPCPHPYHLSASDLATLDQGGSIAVGVIQAMSSITAATQDHASRQETASVTFDSWDASTLAMAVESNLSPDFVYVAGLSAGTQMLSSINVTQGATFTSNDAPLASLPAPVLPTGATFWTNSGGPDLAASTFAFTLPPPIQINGILLLEWTASQPQTITWNPAGYDSGAILQASLYSTNGGTGGLFLQGTLGAASWISVRSGVTLTAPASAGTLTFPSQMLAQVGSGAATLMVQVTEASASIPSTLLKQTNGQTLLMLASPSSGETVPVDIQ